MHNALLCPVHCICRQEPLTPWSTGDGVVDQRGIEAVPGMRRTEQGPAESTQVIDTGTTAPVHHEARADLDPYGREWLAAAAGVLEQAATPRTDNTAAGFALSHVPAGTNTNSPTADELHPPQSVAGTDVHVGRYRQGGGHGAGSSQVEGPGGGAGLSTLEPFGSVTPLPQLLLPSGPYKMQHEGGRVGGAAEAGQQVRDDGCGSADGGPIHVGQLDPNKHRLAAVETVGVGDKAQLDGQRQDVGEHQEALPRQQQQGQPQPPPFCSADGVGAEEQDGRQQRSVQEIGGNEKRGEGADGWVEVARVQLPPPQQQQYEKVEGRRFQSTPGPVGGSWVHDWTSLSSAQQKSGSLDGEAAAVPAASAGPGPGAADLLSELMVGSDGEAYLAPSWGCPGDSGRLGGCEEQQAQRQQQQRDVEGDKEAAWEAAAEQHVPQGETDGQDHHVASLRAAHADAHHVHRGGTLVPLEYGEEEHGGRRAARAGSMSCIGDDAQVYGKVLYDTDGVAAAGAGSPDAADSASSSSTGDAWEPLSGAHTGQGGLWEDTDFRAGHVRGGAQVHMPLHAFSHVEHEAMLASVIAALDHGDSAGVAMDGADRDGHHGGGGVAERLAQLSSTMHGSARASMGRAETEEADIADLR